MGITKATPVYSSRKKRGEFGEDRDHHSESVVTSDNENVLSLVSQGKEVVGLRR